MLTINNIFSMSDINQDAIARHEKIQKSYALKKKAKDFPVSTDDSEVRRNLWQLGQPITLFAEDKGFRRERLKEAILDYLLKYETAPVFAGG